MEKFNLELNLDKWREVTLDNGENKRNALKIGLNMGSEISM